tara:strand:- start:175 stop:699 length:525 start_codon:yes stop_codon:yes gene_type:complete
MGFELRKEKSTSLAQTYKGPKTSAEFTFSFPNLPFINESSQIANLIDAGKHFAPGMKEKLLSYTVEEDTAPRPNKFRVTIITAGEPEREVSGTISKGAVSISGVGAPSQVGAQAVGFLPLLPLLGIGLAISVILIGGVVAFRISKMGEKSFMLLAIGGLAALAGLGYVYIKGRN